MYLPIPKDYEIRKVIDDNYNLEFNYSLAQLYVDGSYHLNIHGHCEDPSLAEVIVSAMYNIRISSTNK